MVSYTVADMTCGHCASTITRAVKALDGRAQVSIDLGRKLVTVDCGSVPETKLRAAIAEAGYDPVLVQDASR